MTPEILKKQVREAFAGVDSSEFLNKKIEEEKTKLSYKILEKGFKERKLSFKEYFSDLSQVNLFATSNEEIMAIGIHLLALEELEKDFYAIP
jgi:uncharacterized protein YqeY